MDSSFTFQSRFLSFAAGRVKRLALAAWIASISGGVNGSDYLPGGWHLRVWRLPLRHIAWHNDPTLTGKMTGKSASLLLIAPKTLISVALISLR